MDSSGLRALIVCALLGWTISAGAARADEPRPDGTSEATLVKAANAPISSIFQLRLANTYVPEFRGDDGDGNTVLLGVTMPLPEYRLIRFPQLSLLSLPAPITDPDGATGIGDLRLLDIAVLDAGHTVLWGIGPSLVFPTASEASMGQGKWQVGPAAAISYAPTRWLFGVLLQNPFSVGGDRDRAAVKQLLVQPFMTYQLGGGWFLRSQPQMVFDWENDRQIVPIDLGVAPRPQQRRDLEGERRVATGVLAGLAAVHPHPSAMVRGAEVQHLPGSCRGGDVEVALVPDDALVEERLRPLCVPVARYLQGRGVGEPVLDQLAGMRRGAVLPEALDLAALIGVDEEVPSAV